MDILTYINRMNQIYGNGPAPAPRYNTQQYLQGGRVGYQSGQLVQPGPGRQGYAGKKLMSKRQAKEIQKTLPEGISLSFSEKENRWRLAAEIVKDKVRRYRTARTNPTLKEIKEVIKEYRVASKKVYPNSLNDDEFLKLRLSKKYKNLTAQQFADELNKIPQKDRTIGYKTVNGKDFTKGNVDNITYKLDIQKEVGQGVKNLSKSQQKILTNAFPEYAGKWDFKANKYGMNFSDVGKDVWNILRHTADDKKKWPTGVTAKSRLWHNAYRSALKGGDEGRFRILHPADGKIMSRDEITKYDWSKGSSKVKFRDTLAKKTFDFNNFENWMNNDAVPGQADANRFKNAANQYDLNKKLKQTKVGDETLGSLLDEKFKGKTKRVQFSGLINHHQYEIANNFWDTDIVFFKDNIGVAKFEKGARAELKAIANLPEAEQTKALKNLTKKFEGLGPIRMVEGEMTIGSYDQKKMLENVGAQLELKKGTPLHTELMKYCPRGKSVGGSAGTCSIDEAANGLKKEVDVARKTGKYGKVGKIGRLAGGFFGWVDAPIELAFALPHMLRGDVNAAKRATTLGLTGWGGDKELEISRKKSPMAYRSFKRKRDIDNYIDNWFRSEKDKQTLETAPEEFKSDLKQNITTSLTNMENISKNFPAADPETMYREDKRGREYIREEAEKRARAGLTLAPELFGGINFAPGAEGQKLDTLEKYIKYKGEPYWKNIEPMLEDLNYPFALHPYQTKDERDRYSELPIKLASELGPLEAKETQTDLDYLESEKIPFFKSGGRVSFVSGGFTRRGFLKLLAALGIGAAGAKSGVSLFTKAAGKKAAVKTGVDIATGTQGMPSWFPALVNKIIKEGDDVTSKLATKDRQIVHSKKVEGHDVDVYRDLDTGDIRVSVEGKTGKNLTAYDEGLELEYKAGEVIEEGTMKGKKTKPEFSNSETEAEFVRMGPDDAELDFAFRDQSIYPNTPSAGSKSISDTSFLKNYATNKKPTLKEIAQTSNNKKQIKYLKENPHEDPRIPDPGDYQDPDIYDDYLPDIDDID